MSFIGELQKRIDDVFRKPKMAGKSEWEPSRAQKIQSESPGTKFGKKRDENSKQNNQKEF